MKCPNCGSDNPDSQRFCGNCGSPLILEEIKGEKKNITVLFADISNFTAISETLDPEEVQDLLNSVFEVISEASEKYGGTIDKFIGDEALILFGAPVSTENHIEMAIRCALEIRRNVSDMASSLSVKVEMHMGIHTGKVVLGEVGGTKVREFTVIGDTVNLASRLRVLAPPGEIYISGETAKKAKAFADIEFISETTVRGRSGNVLVYKITGIKKERESARGFGDLSSPMVGRENELKMLVDIYIGTAMSKKLSVVIIEGDAGIGKSRLYNEFLEWIDTTTIYRTRFLPFAQEPDYPMKNILRQYFNISDDTPSVEAQSNIEAKLKVIEGIPPDSSQIVAKFLSIIPYGENEDPKVAREALLFIAEKLVKYEASNILIIGIEDLHWADRTSLETFEYLVNFIKDTPVMFVFMARPTFESPFINEWRNKVLKREWTTHIKLSPLSIDDSGELISNLLNIEKLPFDVKRSILEKGEGNPLFIEEIIRSLMELGLIYSKDGKYYAKEEIEEFEVPNSIEDIILSRVDNLRLNEKKVIQTASVIGNVFWDSPLKHLLNTNVDSSLKLLEDKDLIKSENLSSFEDSKEFKFKHILLRETIYKSILRRIRKSYHKNFADWLLENYPEKERQLITHLAYHFEMGEEYESAIKYYILAGDTFSSQYAPNDAIESYKKALLYIKQLNILRDKLWEVFNKLGRQYSIIGMAEEAEGAFNNALLFAMRNSDICLIKHYYGEFLQKTSRYEEAIRNLQEALDLCEEDNKFKITVYLEMIWVYRLKGELDTAIKKIEELKAYISELEDKMPTENFDMSWAYYYKVSAALKSDVGDIKGSIEDNKRALNLYEKSNDIMSIGAIYNNLANEYGSIGELSKAIKMYKKSIEMEKMVGNRLGVAVSYYNLGGTYSFLGDLDRAFEYYNEYLSLNKLIHNRLGDGFGNSGLSGLFFKRDDNESAFKHIDISIDIFRELGAKYMECASIIKKASMLLEIGRLDEYSQLLQSVYEYIDRIDNIQLKYEIEMLKANEMLERGNLFDCEVFLKSAEEKVEKIGDILSLKDFYITKIKLYEKKGDLNSVNLYKEKLREWVDKILDGIKEDELKEKFLKSPNIKEYIN